MSCVGNCSVATLQHLVGELLPSEYPKRILNEGGILDMNHGR
jgi:hypothetical protein